MSFAFAAVHRAKAKLGMYFYLLVVWHRCFLGQSLRVLTFIILGIITGPCIDLLLIFVFRSCPPCVGNADSGT